MFDLETLAVEPGAVVLSIGAMSFRPFDKSDGAEPNTFYRNIDPASCEAVGLMTDPDVAKWWMHADRRLALREMSANKRPIREVVKDFNEWFIAQRAECVWSHGATFDVPIWETASKFCGVSVPWHFTKVRDTRTLFDLAGVNFRALMKEGTYHNALDDAKNQAAAVRMSLMKLGLVEA